MKRAIVIAAAVTCATSVAAQDVYIVPRQEGVISRLFRMQQESDAAAHQQALQNEQIKLMEAQRKVLEAQARANNGTHPQMPQWMAGHGARPSRRLLFWWKVGERCAEVRRLQGLVPDSDGALKTLSPPHVNCDRNTALMWAWRASRRFTVSSARNCCAIVIAP